MEPDRPSARSRASERGRSRATWAASCLSAALLVFVALDGRSRDPAIDTTEFHRRLSEIAEEAVPLRFGDWVGTKLETHAAAVAILHPNLLLNRRYRNIRTGEGVSFLFVHCSDARDLSGHYPPVCYPANGLMAGGAQARDWTIGRETIPAMRYTFLDTRSTTPLETVVDNFMVLPVDGFGRDMESVQLAAKDRRRRVYGAAQVQVLTGGDMGSARRDEVFRSFVEAALPLIALLKVEAEIPSRAPPKREVVRD